MKVVTLRVDGKVAWIQINRPEALNAINLQVIAELDSCLTELESQPSIVLAVLETAGDKAFIAGADIKEMSDFSAQQASQFSEFGHRVFQRFENLATLTVARVQGFALGGGLELAMCCDLIFASENAKFGMPEVSLGLIPGFGGTQRLAERIGRSRALEWIASAQKYSATKALELGLVNSVFVKETFDKELNLFIEAVLKNGPNAVKLAKKCISKPKTVSNVLGNEIEIGSFGLSFGTQESREGMDAFLQKRLPKF